MVQLGTFILYYRNGIRYYDCFIGNDPSVVCQNHGWWMLSEASMPCNKLDTRYMNCLCNLRPRGEKKCHHYLRACSSSEWYLNSSYKEMLRSVRSKVLTASIFFCWMADIALSKSNAKNWTYTTNNAKSWTLGLCSQPDQNSTKQHMFLSGSMGCLCGSVMKMPLP